MFRNKKMSRVALALAALVVSLIMTVTATYAWFTYNSTVSVNNIEINSATGGELLQINVEQSTTATGGFPAWQSAAWSTGIAFTDLEDVLDLLVGAKAANEYAKFRLGAFSTTDGVNFINEDGDELSVASGGTLTAGKGFNPINIVDSVNGGVLEFAINFRSSTELSIGLSDTSTVTTSTGALTGFVSAWSSISAAKYGENHGAISNGGKICLSAAYAARFSLTTNASTPKTYIWNPEDSIVEQRTEGTDNYYIFNDSKTTAYTGTAPNWTGGNNFAHEYRKAVLGSYPKVVNETYSAGVEMIDELATDGHTFLMTLVTGLNGNYYGRIVVRIWLEGTDTSCVNSILKDTFTSTLQFTVVTAPVGP